MLKKYLLTAICLLGLGATAFATSPYFYSNIITQLTPGVAAANLGKAEDSAHTSGDTGVALWSVRTDTMAPSAGSTGDYQTLQTDSNGRLRTFEQFTSADGVSPKSDIGATSTGTTPLTAAATVFSVQACNGDSVANTVKLYDKATAATSSDTPISRILVAAGACNTVTATKGFAVANGLSVRATNELTDSGTTGAAANKILVNFTYK